MSDHPMTPGTTTRPHQDTRTDQAARVADFLELNPNSTAKEIDAACDVDSVTEVISNMPLLGYGIVRAWRQRIVSCAGGDERSRMVRTYALTHPDHQANPVYSPAYAGRCWVRSLA